ncbi:hypothetical protein M885DRAFT_574187 [Pelagophyceae sp. CCMP2097]|nr:hypothetical protein M885DRAFT_574187 [Pelagophyceae sp. CCMP2097]
MRFGWALRCIWALTLAGLAFWVGLTLGMLWGLDAGAEPHAAAAPQRLRAAAAEYGRRDEAIQHDIAKVTRLVARLRTGDAAAQAGAAGAGVAQAGAATEEAGAAAAQAAAGDEAAGAGTAQAAAGHSVAAAGDEAAGAGAAQAAAGHSVAAAGDEAAGAGDEAAGREAAAAPTVAAVPASGAPSTSVHIFYYAWYLSLAYDQRWAHWDHDELPHWDANVRKRFPPFKHDPDQADIGSSFWPELGAYSSRDLDVIEAHMAMISKARIGVVVLSWYSPGHQDGNGENTDGVVLPLLAAALRHGVEIALHLEPYEGRTASSTVEDMRYAIEHYSAHPSYHHAQKNGRKAPVFYAYDSYQISPADWRDALRGVEVYVIGLVLDSRQLSEYGPVFDGTYSYFGATGFTAASTPKAWPSLVQKSNKEFVPCVSPGYDDVRVRPWNAANQRGRANGEYYDAMWRSALESGSRTVAITSFNEWHEGTQIEPSVPKKPRRQGVADYSDYLPNAPNFFLDKTRKWIDKFAPP